MTTLKNFQAEIEEIHARERSKQHTQGDRVLPSDGQRREAHAPSALGAGGTTTYEQSDLHSSEQEERILVSHCPVIIDEYLDISVSIGTARYTQR
jgi:hypothetical protein